jgi:hypothetical protein
VEVVGSHELALHYQYDEQYISAVKSLDMRWGGGRGERQEGWCSRRACGGGKGGAAGGLAGAGRVVQQEGLLGRGVKGAGCQPGQGRAGQGRACCCRAKWQAA